MRPDPKCVIDRSRACGACIAPSPCECPYAFLLDSGELTSVVEANRNVHRRTRAAAEADDS